MQYSLTQIEAELKKRLTYPYKWLQKQNDYFDKKTNFIYHTFEFENVLKEIELRFKSETDYEKYFNYSINRWFNFWSAYAVENIFCSIDGVTPAQNSKDRQKDFIIQGVAFDHKTSVLPKEFTSPIKEIVRDSGKLIEWFYDNQSKQQRKHFKNRLFVVLYSSKREHWKLKSELSWLKKIIEHYMLGFNAAYLMKFNFNSTELTLSDIIWAIEE